MVADGTQGLTRRDRIWYSSSSRYMGVTLGSNVCNCTDGSCFAMTEKKEERLPRLT